MSIFEQASRLKLRFETMAGVLSADDLWDLPLAGGRAARSGGPAGGDLNSIAIDLHAKLQSSAVSFVEPATSVNPSLQLRFDVVKHIIDVRLAEQKTAKEAAERKERKQKLMRILASKEDAALEGMSVEDLRKLIDET